MNVIFIGMKHCGKTSFGKALAAQWQCRFYDTDDLIMSTYNKSSEAAPLTVREIFKTLGEEGFRQLEDEILQALYDELSSTQKRYVISMGGGMPMNKNFDLMSKVGLVAYLKCEPDVLYERIMRSGKVPFINQENPKTHFEQILQKRMPVYEQHAELILALGNKPLAENKAYVIDQVTDYIKSTNKSVQPAPDVTENL